MKSLMSIRFLLLAGFLLTSAMVGPTAALAGGVTISPVVIEVDSPRKAAAIKVTNDGDQALILQSDTLVWTQVNGVDHYAPSDELLVVPPIVTVPPNSSQIFRVMLRVPKNAGTERTFRLLLEDITNYQTVEGQTQIALKFTHNLPVLIAPAGKVVKAFRWKPCAPRAVAALSAEACVRLFNAGNRRVKVKTLTLTGDGWQQALSLQDGENVLAGAEREWRVPLSSGQTGSPIAVQVHTMQGERLQAEAGGL